MVWRGLSICILSLLVSCGGGGGDGSRSGTTDGPPPPVTSPGAVFFPLDVDARWVYQEGAGLKVTRFGGTEALPGGGQGTVLVDTSIDGQTLDRSTYEVRNDGIYQHPGSNADAFSTAIGVTRVLAFPVQAGTSFVQFDGTVNVGDVDSDGRIDPVRLRSVVEAVGLGPCTFGGLRFDTCLHQRISVTAVTSLSRSRAEITETFVSHEWYAPGVGLVRQAFDEEGASPTQLIAYKVKDLASDRLAPVISAQTPAADTTVAGSLVASVTFDEVIDPTSVSQLQFSVQTESGEMVPGRTVLDSDIALRFVPAQAWAGGRYQVQLNPGVADLLGNRIESVVRWSFQVDVTSPTLVSHSPAPGSGILGLMSPIRLTFSEPIDPATANISTVQMLDTIRPDLSTRIRLAVEGSALTLTPLDVLRPATEYTIRLGTGLTDLVGNPLAEEVNSQIFTSQGRFAFPQRIETDIRSDAMTLGDIDGDGLIDLVYRGTFSFDESSGRLYVQRGLPGARWSRPELIDDQSCPSAGNLLVADLDGNGLADVARGGVGCGLRIRYQLSDGTMGPAQQLSNAPLSALKAADLNGDGRKDLVAIGGSTYRVWLQNQAGQLVLQTARELDFPSFGGVNGLIDLHMRGLEIGDMNGDGRLDIVVTLSGDTDPRRLMILHQRVDGTWAEPLYDTKGGGDSFALGDLNGDGRLDLAFTGGYVLQQPGGSFGLVVMFPEEFAFGNYAVTLADIDGNGLVDILSRSTIESSVRIVVQRQQIGGFFASPEIYHGGGYNEGALFAIDLNGDRMLDVIDGLTLLMQIGSEQPTLAQSTRASPARAMNAAAKQQPASVTASWPSKLRAHWRH